MTELRRAVAHHGTWTAVLLVVLCLVGGLRVGDARAGRAAEVPKVLQDRLLADSHRLDLWRTDALTAERDAAYARQDAARAALAAHVAGRPHAEALLPAGMRFVCVDRAAGRCVVVAETARRTTRLVWPLTRPVWAARLGLPPGRCVGEVWPSYQGGSVGCR